MLEFDDKKVVGTIQIPIEVTEKDVDTIIVNGFEGGTNYWMGLYNDGEVWEEKPKGEPLSTWATKMLVEGKSIFIHDLERDDWEYKSAEHKHELTLEKLLKGIEMNSTHRKWDSSIEDGDATTYDCIIQYAIFGELVYG